MSKPELYFRLSKTAGGREVDDVDLWRNLIEAVPAVWGWKGWLDGELMAPFRMLREGGASRELWLELGDFDGRFPFTVSPSDRVRDLTPDLVALLIRKKNPGCVRFDKVGYLPRNKSVTFEAARELAAYYVSRGYRGHLSFVSAGHTGDFSKNPLSCDLQFSVWEGRYPEVGRQQPRIRLQWREEFGGKRSDLEPLESLCREHGLEQYEFIGASDYYRRFERQLEMSFEEPLREPLARLVAAE